MNNIENGVFYGVGVGPGDEELLTLKAVRIIGQADVIVAPCAKNGGDSIALKIIKKFIDNNTEVITKHFPMGDEDQQEKIYDAFLCISEKLSEGKNVVFITIGDPLIYSTYIYLLKYIKEAGYKSFTIPGITSFTAAAAASSEILVIGNEPLLIIPGSRVKDIKEEKYVVIMKVYKCEEEILNTLEEKGFKYVYVKKASREGQEILRNREEILRSKEYMALIIASKK